MALGQITLQGVTYAAAVDLPQLDALTQMVQSVAAQLDMLTHTVGMGLHQLGDRMAETWDEAFTRIDAEIHSARDALLAKIDEEMVQLQQKIQDAARDPATFADRVIAAIDASKEQLSTAVSGMIPDVTLPPEPPTEPPPV